VQFVLARAPHLADELFAPLASANAHVAVVENATDEVLASADAVVTASGTATVQAAIHECPMVIVYRVAPLTHAIGRRFVHVDTFGMVNLVAGERVAPELIQDGFTADAVADHAVRLLTDASARERAIAALREVKAKLGGGGASRRAAEIVLDTARPHTR
jgi:lipid-A-disaccharide synthase